MDYLHAHPFLIGSLATASILAFYALFMMASNLYQDFVDFSQRFRGVK